MLRGPGCGAGDASTQKQDAQAGQRLVENYTVPQTDTSGEVDEGRRDLLTA